MLNTGIKTRGEPAVLWNNAISFPMHIHSILIRLTIIWSFYSIYAESALFNNMEIAIENVRLLKNE